MNKIFSLLTLVLAIILTGCSSILLDNLPGRGQESAELKKISTSAFQLDGAEIEQLSKIFRQHNLALAIDATEGDYFIEALELKGEYKDLYKNTANDALFLDVSAELIVTVKHKYSQEIVLQRFYRRNERLYPNANFYSQRGWYKAQLQFESQQKLFDDFAKDLAGHIETYEKNT